MNSPKMILPKKIREDPFARPNIIHESQLKDLGMYNLLNRGYIAKDIDIGPAFLKG